MKKYNPEAFIFILIHKIDIIPEEERKDKYLKKK